MEARSLQRTLLFSAVCLALVLGVAGSLARAADAGRGKSLYEGACSGCHDRSVHARSPRAATNFAEIRAFVTRWANEVSAGWRNDEITDVTVYLNERYYGFECPQPACGVPRADAAAALSLHFPRTGTR